jgi:hypothetical protein
MQTSPQPKRPSILSKVPIWASNTFALGISLGALFGYAISSITDVYVDQSAEPLYFKLYRLLVCAVIFGLPFGLWLLSVVAISVATISVIIRAIKKTPRT